MVPSEEEGFDLSDNEKRVVLVVTQWLIHSMRCNVGYCEVPYGGDGFMRGF